MRAGVTAQRGRGRLAWLLASLAVWLAAVTLYAQTWSYPLLSWDDDVNIAANRWLLAGDWTKFWLQPYTGLFVPVPYTVWAAIYRLAGDSGAYHLVNTCWHGLNAALVMLVIRRRCGASPDSVDRPWPWLPAVVGACYFGWHPLQVEAVAWASGMRDLCSATLVLVAMLAYAGRWSRQPWLYWLGLLAFCAALLSKPSAVMLPLVLLVLDVICDRRDARSAVLGLLPWFAVAVGVVLGTWAVQSESVTSPLMAPTLLERGFIVLDSLGFYLAKSLVPTALAVDYGRISMLILARGEWLYPCFGLIAIFALCLALWLRLGAVIAGGIMLLLFMLPTSGAVPFAFQRVSTVADRYMYLPMIGLAVLLANVTRLLAPRLQWLALLACLPLLVLSNQRITIWKDDLTFFQAMLAAHPASFSAHSGLGTLALGQGDATLALKHYEAALAEQPTNVLALANVGLVLARLGYYGQVLERIAPLVPDDSELVHHRLSTGAVARMLEVIGFAQVQLDQVAAGLSSYRRASRLDPDNATLAARVVVVEQQLRHQLDASESSRDRKKPLP